MPEQSEFLALGQTMSVGELRAALATRDGHERVNVFVKIADEAVALEDLTKVTHHQTFDPDGGEGDKRYRSVCLHVRGMELVRLLHPRRPISPFTF